MRATWRPGRSPPLSAAGVEAGSVGVETPSTGPRAELLDRLARGDRHRDDAGGGLDQGQVQESGQAAAGADLGTGPVAGLGPGLVGVETEVIEVLPPDPLALGAGGQVEKEGAVEAFGAHELRGQLAHVIAGADDEDIAVVVIQPGEKTTEQAGGDAAVGGTAGGDAGEGLLDLVDHDHGGRHGVDEPQCLTDVALGLPHERAHQAAHVEDQRGSAGLGPKPLREGALARAGRAQQEDAACRHVLRAIGSEGAGAEPLERVQPAQFVEPLAALVEREQAALAEGLGLEFPEHPGLEPAVPHE